MLKRLALATLVLTSMTVGAMAQTEWWERQDWKTDFSKTTVEFTEIVDVIGKDNIPSVDDPQFQPAADETSIPGQEPVVAFEHNGEARAYPLRYLMWHEIVNDTIGDLPVAVTYCPLCNTAIVFERVLDGAPVTFGTTGKLRHSDLIMYDRGEENWWQQFNGEALVGQRAGQKLNALPSFLISFDLFKERYPEGAVMLADSRRASSSGVNPYRGYDSANFPFLFRGDLPKDIEPMMRVAFVQSPDAIAVTLPYLKENAPVVIDDLEFRWTAGQSSALDTESIADGRDVGNIEVFKLSDGNDPEPVVYTVTFAFAARAFKPDLEIVQ